MMLNKTDVLWNNRIVGLLQKAGYAQLTPLQQKVMPLILKGKDILVEAGEKTGKTAAFILPILEKLDINKAGIKALVLSATFENAKKITREFKKFLRHSQSPVEVAILGKEKGEKAEFRTLTARPDIVVGPTDRIIDHIRRGNMSFESLQFVVIEGSDQKQYEGFNQDIHFIMTKLSSGYQSILFSPMPLSELNDLLSLFRRPVLVNESDWKDNSSAGTCGYFIVPPGQADDKKLSLVRLMIARKIQTLLILLNDEKSAAGLVKYLSDSGFPARAMTSDMKPEDKLQMLKSFSAHNFNVLAASVNSIENTELVHASHIVYFDMTDNFGHGLELIPRFLRNVCEVLLFLSAESVRELQKNEEFLKLSMRNETLPKDEDVLKSYIETIIQKIKEQEDPEEIKQLRKIITRYIPVFSRTTVLTYLFRELYQKKFPNIHKSSRGRGKIVNHKTGSKTGTNAGVNTGGNNGNTGRPTTTLFLSVGKNRRVFPADITELFTSVLRINESDIREVKILDNYSFVEIATPLAARAINELNGKDFKGKKLSINYARKKERRPKRTNRPKNKKPE